MNARSDDLLILDKRSDEFISATNRNFWSDFDSKCSVNAEAGRAASNIRGQTAEAQNDRRNGHQLQRRDSSDNRTKQGLTSG